ncbi:unnamed protein product [Didymodactylos carnosus]|uniref:15-oxoprostaglandin 13-reductase n=1 Tax=Didymodactylos carnosus TaxID=1234261 RepID=A0A814X5G8_9BILA|nr:unnamed protein product [Didymodactylos carnosus]CAF3975559.1 unnamed protein product [Didymodactylos carnosus]
MPSSNNAIIYKAHPTEFPEAGVHLAFEKRPYDLDELQKDEFITENLFLSIDPYQRGRMRAPETKSYFPPFAIGSPIQSGGVGRVIKSNNANFPVGKLVLGLLDWSEYSKVTPGQGNGLKVLENKYNLPLSRYTGILDMPGMTAYASLYEIGQPKKGETIFISAASGAVGQIVGQLAKREGLTVVGSAGTAEKVKYLKEKLHFDEAFNYKEEKPSDALAKYCPKGIDIYFENVGGETLDACLVAANPHARFIMCGMISQYNTKKEDQYGVKNLMLVVAKSITMRGFIVTNLWQKYNKEFYENMERWLKNGELKYQEDITDGLEKAPEAFVGMLKGKNFGKALIAVKGNGAN